MLFCVIRLPNTRTVMALLVSSTMLLSVTVFWVYPMVNSCSCGSPSSPWWMSAIFLPGCCMIIPTSRVCDVLLFAIPNTRSSMTTEFDSIIYELPDTIMSPVTSKLDAITVVPLSVLMVDARRYPSDPITGK